jgi:hypothetical protein
VTPWCPSLQVELPMDELAGYSVATPDLAARYKYKNLRAALAQIPTGGGKAAGSISTKVGWRVCRFVHIRTPTGSCCDPVGVLL